MDLCITASAQSGVPFVFHFWWQPIEDIMCTIEPPQLINQRSQFQFTQSDLNNIKTMFKKVYFK